MLLSVTIGSKLEEIKAYVKEISQPPDWSIKIIALQSLTLKRSLKGKVARDFYRGVKNLAFNTFG